MNKKSDRLSQVNYPEAMKLPCPSCGNSGALKVGQLNFRGQLKWYESVNCDKCGLRSEADGVGFPPSKLREMLIESDGEWCVSMMDVHSTASVINVLRSALSLDMKAALALLKAESKVLFRGTRSEALWLNDLLEKIGETPVLLAVGENC